MYVNASGNPSDSDAEQPNRWSRRTFLQVGGGFGLLLFAGCSSSSNDDDSSPSTSATTDPDSTTTVSADDGAGATTLRVALPSYPGSWDQDFVGFDLVALAMYKNIFPYMVDYAVTEIDGAEVLDTTNIVPSLAQSWESDEEGRIWTLTIKEGLKFPSGNPLTANDVKWSKDRAFAAQANVAGIYRLIGLTSPDQIEVVDELTVRFTQEFPSPLAPQIQAISLFVFDSELAKENATPDDEWAQEWMAGTPADGGRFNVESAIPGQEIVLVSNPDFGGTDPARVARIEMPVVDSAGSRRLQLESGDVDIALGLGRQDIDDLSGVDGITVLSSPSNIQVKVDMLMTAAPFDDVEVRKAFATAVPYQQVIDNVYKGEARRSNSPVPLDMPGNSPDGFPFDTDAAAAKSILTEAGYDGIESELVYAAGDIEQEQIAVLLASSMAEAGFTLTPTPLDPAALAERRGAKTIPLQVTAGQLWVDDVEYLLSTSLTEGAFLNYSGYRNERIEEIFAASHTVVDPTERLALWQEVQSILAEDVPWAVICQPSFSLPVRSNVSGWVQPVDGLMRLQYLQMS